MKKFLPVLLAISFFGFIIFSAILPGFAKDVAKKKKQVAALREEEKNLPSLANELSAKSDKIVLLNKSFPARKELVLVVQTLDTLALQAGVSATLHFESEQPTKDSQGDTILPISISIEGDFEKNRDFISSILHNRYLYNLELVDGKAPNGLKGDNMVLVKGKLYVAGE